LVTRNAIYRSISITPFPSLGSSRQNHGHVPDPLKLTFH
jgi:hypothetical protein